MDQQRKEKIFKLLSRIPKGKVTTYKILAERSGIKNPRHIGQIIHKNKNPQKFPCHRVIRSDGTVASGYAFGGHRKQVELLKKEGVKFSGQKVLELDQKLVYPI